MKIKETYIVYYRQEWTKLYFCSKEKGDAFINIYMIESWNKGNVHYYEVSEEDAKALIIAEPKE